MLLWILTIVVVVVAIVVGVLVAVDACDVFSGIGPFVGTLVLGGLAIIMTLAVCIPAFWGHMSYTTANTTHALKNIGDNSETKGQFYHGIFATYGTVDGNRTVNFVEEHDGYAQLGQVDADYARIHEGAKSPHIVRHDYTWYNKGLLPWALAHSTDYDFYVPAGIISQDFAIGNGGADNG